MRRKRTPAESAELVNGITAAWDGLTFSDRKICLTTTGETLPGCDLAAHDLANQLFDGRYRLLAVDATPLLDEQNDIISWQARFTAHPAIG